MVDRVGQGRYGEVWLARWRGERVAVKVRIGNNARVRIGGFDWDLRFEQMYVHVNLGVREVFEVDGKNTFFGADIYYVIRSLRKK